MRPRAIVAAAVAWGVLLVSVVAYVVAYDLWAHFTGHRTMSNQMGHWLVETVMGPVIVGLYFALICGLGYHFLQEMRRGR
jgi:hypothetical protein